jgi:hypothetical protein
VRHPGRGHFTAGLFGDDSALLMAVVETPAAPAWGIHYLRFLSRCGFSDRRVKALQAEGQAQRQGAGVLRAPAWRVQDRKRKTGPLRSNHLHKGPGSLSTIATNP